MGIAPFILPLGYLCQLPKMNYLFWGHSNIYIRCWSVRGHCKWKAQYPLYV